MKFHRNNVVTSFVFSTWLADMITTGKVMMADSKQHMNMGTEESHFSLAARVSVLTWSSWFTTLLSGSLHFIARPGNSTARLLFRNLMVAGRGSS